MIIKFVQFQEGENSWAFYRGKNVDEAKQSLILRCSNLKPTPALSLRDFCNAIWSESNEDFPLIFAFHFTVGTRAARRSILIVLVLSCGTHYSGFGILAYNSTSIFDKMGSFLTPIQSSIAIAIVQFCASSFNIFLIDRFGRRSLLILSSGGVAVHAAWSFYQFIIFSKLNYRSLIGFRFVVSF